MSCWVVPSIAAEFWGIPIASVLDGARNGKFASKNELGFMLIDVAPDSPRAEMGFRRPAAVPLTYITPSDELNEAERMALSADEPQGEISAEEEAALNGTEADRFDWRAARRAAARKRRSPKMMQMAA